MWREGDSRIDEGGRNKGVKRYDERGGRFLWVDGRWAGPGREGGVKAREGTGRAFVGGELAIA